MRISDWSSDVCSSDLRISYHASFSHFASPFAPQGIRRHDISGGGRDRRCGLSDRRKLCGPTRRYFLLRSWHCPQRGSYWPCDHDGTAAGDRRSEEHTSELQSLMRISYAVFSLKKKTNKS